MRFDELPILAFHTKALFLRLQPGGKQIQCCYCELNAPWAVDVEQFRTQEGMLKNFRIVIPKGFRLAWPPLPWVAVIVYQWLRYIRPLGNALRPLMAALLIRGYAYHHGRLPGHRVPSTATSRANVDKMVQEIQLIACQTRSGRWLEKYFRQPERGLKFVQLNPLHFWKTRCMITLSATLVALSVLPLNGFIN
ncbi:hypothetical protein DXV75_04360 [Alteromonas aestuariivivens]|uniref:DUF1353 domain-containing protein n=2 Tax=Alteromonas aestuariivivens TaxID=1938339 RepID=A0A3D8MD27_9ALTE|nr:hypothetical protein DXV75_04360 [Alteromonas aestuariivivens]